MLALDLADRRTMWREYWLEWVLAGLLVFINEAAEWRIAELMSASIPFMTVLPPLLISIFAWVLRFGLFAVGDPGAGLWMLVLSMIVYGMAFDFFNISGSLFVDREAAPEIRASAQGLFMIMTNGIGAFVGGTASGWVVDYFTRDGVKDWRSIWLSFAGYALVLGLIALVFEAVPYIGPILAAVPALLLSTGEGGLMPLWVLIAYLTVQALENNLIMPVVVGGQLQLHPVAVIFSMLLCVTVFGVLGVLIAMPMVAVFMIFHEEVYRPRFLPNVTDEDLDRIGRTTLDKRAVLSPEEKPVETSSGREESHTPPS